MTRAASFAAATALAAVYADATATPPGPDVPWPLPIAEDSRAELAPARDARRGGRSLEDADWAAVTALEEAPPEGQVAVLHVIARRMRACGCRARDVVRAPMQFQPWREHKARRMSRRLRAPDAATMRAAATAYDVLRGRVADPTGGATHFHAAAYLGATYAPAWAPAFQRTGEHGGNVFYRGILHQVVPVSR